MADTQFAQLFSITGGPNLIRQFGEYVVYYCKDGSPGREIQAMVQRGTLEIIAETGDLTSQALIIAVHNNRMTGIASDEIDTGGDEIEVALRVCEAVSLRPIVRVLNDSNGLVRFLCQ